MHCTRRGETPEGYRYSPSYYNHRRARVSRRDTGTRRTRRRAGREQKACHCTIAPVTPLSDMCGERLVDAWVNAVDSEKQRKDYVVSPSRHTTNKYLQHSDLAEDARRPRTASLTMSAVPYILNITVATFTFTLTLTLGLSSLPFLFGLPVCFLLFCINRFAAPYLAPRARKPSLDCPPFGTRDNDGL